jgi:hypothetical protein
MHRIAGGQTGFELCLDVSLRPSRRDELEQLPRALFPVLREASKPDYWRVRQVARRVGRNLRRHNRVPGRHLTALVNAPIAGQGVRLRVHVNVVGSLSPTILSLCGGWNKDRFGPSVIVQEVCFCSLWATPRSRPLGRGRGLAGVQKSAPRRVCWHTIVRPER